MSNLTVRSKRPNTRITADWNAKEKKIIEAQLFKNITSKDDEDEEKAIYKEGKYKRISDFVNGDFKKLDKSLVKLQVFVGALEPMSDGALEDLIEFLQDEFEEFSIIEIESAVKMAIAGSLDIEKVENIRFFSAVYLSKILTQYRAERSRVILKYQKGEDIIAEELKDAHNKANAEKNNKEIMQNLCKSAFNNYKDNKTNTDFHLIGVYPVYKFLTESGIIKHTDKETDGFEKRALELLKIRAMTDKRIVQLMKNKDTTAQAEYNGIFDLELKTVIVTNYFQGLINTKKDVLDIFEKPAIPIKIPIVMKKHQIPKNLEKN